MDGDKARDGLTQRILDLTLEMIFLLTGEDHVVVKIHEMDNSSHQIPGGHRRTQSFNMEPPPHSGIHERNNEKILELTHRILRLLTGEVPIRCEDVTVHLSMEEWEYVERHKELYKDVMMEDHQPVITADDSGEFPCDFESENLNTAQESLAFEEICVPERDIYPTTERRAESDLQEGDFSTSDINPLMEQTQTEYPSDSRMESFPNEEGNLADRDVYKPPEHTQTECAPGNFGEYLKDNTNPMGMNLNESLIKSRNPYQSIYYTDHFTNNSIYKGNSAPSSEMGKVSYSESDLVAIETNYKEEEPTFPSSACGDYSTPTSAITHQHVHTEGKPFSCPECGKRFRNNIALKRHERTHTGEKPYKCPECGKCFTHSSSFTRHKRIHTGEKTFKCSECEKCFTQSCYLTDHKKIHTGLKPFKCPECGKCFTQSSHLANHTMIHTGEKPFNCPECGKCFTRALHLAKHKMIHTGEKPFVCSECGKGFTCASRLVSHIRSHTGEKPFECTECGKCFAYSSSVTVHKRIHMVENTHLLAQNV